MRIAIGGREVLGILQGGAGGRPLNMRLFPIFEGGTDSAKETGSRTAQAIEKGNHMLNWTLTFLIIALIAGLLGFTGLAGAAIGIAQILFVVFLVLFLLSLVARGRSAGR